MLSKSLRATRLRNLKKITFNITPSSKTQKPEKLDVESIQKLPQPSDDILENPRFQEQARREENRVRKQIQEIQKLQRNLNVFPDVKDYPAEDN